MYLAYSYPLGQPAIPALGAHTPIGPAELQPTQYLTTVTLPSIADPYHVPISSAAQLQAAASPFQPLVVCRKVGLACTDATVEEK